MSDSSSNHDSVDVTVPITEYTKHIVKEAVTEAMSQHQDSCPLVRTVADLAEDMWGDSNRGGVKDKVRVLQEDRAARKENVSFIKRPFFSGLVGAFFVVVGMVLKGAWEWLRSKI